MSNLMEWIMSCVTPLHDIPCGIDPRYEELLETIQHKLQRDMCLQDAKSASLWLAD